ncbi:MAG: MOSC domain-containing protein [Actinobacteria bacterium]|nr:MOSC domain-containing protein [Actinomycetota bacterium]NIS32191.1 MOSC domain-containing protein [Actinomycetota bacterium]NIT96135.1 MOSC domain-containing protein [Actinomycetota bacterium]NIU19817.1 MOSC domain-containing protein [Actinomycetota bacterium]NIU67252.1 MOSC domain-containing protein [Actinomycetota bacterium]
MDTHASTDEIIHLTREQLEAGLDHIRRSPADGGRLEMIVQRPAEDARVVLEEGELDLEEGLAGDNWKQRGSSMTDDGGAHPDMQLNMMNSRVLALVAQQPERMPLAGDQLIVDLDLSEANLPAWTRLAIGDAVIEVTDQPHRGCAKFSRRFGVEAHRFVNSEAGMALKLRGVNARVVTPGTIRQGDVIRKL